MNNSPLPDGRVVKWIVLLTLLLTLAARLAAGQEVAERSVYQTAKAATVEILGNDHLDGSGWFVDPQGLVITAAHVIAQPDRRIEILSPTIGRLEAKLLAVDMGHDLALLSVAPRDEGYPALALAAEVPPPSEEVFLLGSPIFRHAVQLRGTVACDKTTFEYYTEKYIEALHVAATVQGGMSGGAWLNAKGQVVGLQSGVMSQNGLPLGIADMITVDAIRKLVAARKTASTPGIGMAVEETWQQDHKLLDRFPPRTEGLVVKILHADRPAARAGLKQWDVITAADGKRVRLSDELLRIVRAKKPGETLTLTVLGPDGTGTREVTLALGRLEVGWP